MALQNYITRLQQFVKSFDYRFLVFLLVSTLLWLSMQFSKTNIQVYDINLEYAVPSKKVFAQIPDQKLIVKLKSKTWNLLNSKKLPKTIIIRLSDIDRQTISEASLYNLVEEGILSKYEIIGIIPSAISIHLEDAKTKKIPVKTKGDLTLKSGYASLNDMQIIPDSISIYGREKDLSKYNEWFVDQALPLNISADIDQLYDLETNTIINGVTIEPMQVRIQLQVDQFAEHSYKKKILEIENDANYTIPTYAIVKLGIPLRYIDKINPDDIKLKLLNYKLDDTISKYRITSKSLPPNCELLSIEPDSATVFKQQ